MAAERENTPLIDLAAVCISPILIMTMVGSLVFFLVHVIYGGDYTERVLYTMFFFVIGAVLIARISIRFGRNRAMLYTVALGGAVFLAMQVYVVYPSGLLKAIGPVVNLGLMVLIWWAANKLTWDCTHLDEEREAGGRGSSAATGLQTTEAPPEPPPPDTAEPEAEEAEKAGPGLPRLGGEVQRVPGSGEEEAAHAGDVGDLLRPRGGAAVHSRAVAHSRRRFVPPASHLPLMAAFVGSGLGLSSPRVCSASASTSGPQGEDPRRRDGRMAWLGRRVHRRVPRARGGAAATAFGDAARRHRARSGSRTARRRSTR